MKNKIDLRNRWKCNHCGSWGFDNARTGRQIKDHDKPDGKRCLKAQGAVRDEINVTLGSNWGCQNTDEDGEAYASFAQHWLQQAYPDTTTVTASFNSAFQKDGISIYCTVVSESDVRESLDKCWVAFCDAGWPR